MIYEYHCEKCEKNFDVYKPHTEHRRQEYCPDCKAIGQRLFKTARPIIDKMDSEYYHSFGQVVSTKRQRRELMKIHNVEEVGTEKPEKIHAASEKAIADKRKRNWESV